MNSNVGNEDNAGSWPHWLGRLLAGWRHRPGTAPGNTQEPAAEPEIKATEAILIIEIGAWRAGLLPRRLEQAGYTARVAQGVPAGLECLGQAPTPLVIVGGSRDPTIYRSLRRVSPAYILALVPDVTSDELTTVLDAGADDCQSSVISQAETVARAHALLRHPSQHPSSVCGPL